MPHNRSISFPCADYLLAQKTRPGPVCDRNAVPPCIAFNVNASHRPPTLSTATPATQPRNQGKGISKNEPKRGNMLRFNNFRMVNLIELVSKSQKSQKSHRSRGFKVPCSLSMFIVDVHGSSALFKFTPHVHSPASLPGFMFTLIPRLIPRFQGIIFSNIQGQAGSKVTTKECEGQDDG